MFIRDRITTLRVVLVCSYVRCGCVRGWGCVRTSERVSKRVYVVPRHHVLKCMNE